MSSQSAQRLDGSSRMISPPPSTLSTNGDHSRNGSSVGSSPSVVVEKNGTNSANGSVHGSTVITSVHAIQPSGLEVDVDMDTLEHDEKTVTNGSTGYSSSYCVNGSAGDHATYISDDSSNSGDGDDYPLADMGQ